jgi:hypothetical protein
MELVGGQAAVAVEDQRDRDEPLPDRQVRVVEIVPEVRLKKWRQPRQ